MFKSLKSKKLKAFSLTEIIVVLAIISMVVYGLASFSIDATRLSELRWKSSSAGLKMKDTAKILIDKKNTLWKDLITDSQNKYLLFQSNNYVITNGTEVIDGVTYSFTIQNAYRDGSGNYATSGTLDIGSKFISIIATWTDSFGYPQNLTYTFYVSNWATYNWLQTSLAEFNSGTYSNNTIGDALGGGSVRMQEIIYPDWCNPSLALNQYDLPGNSVSKTVFASTGSAYLGTAGTSTSTALTKLNISGVTPPILSVEGTFGGYAVNDVFVVGNIAYLATTDNSKEVVIVNVATTPYTEIGYFNASGTTDGRNVYVSGTVGYVATGAKVQSFNLTSNTGSRAKYGEITLAQNSNSGTTAYIFAIQVRGNYLFAALNDDYYEMAIATVSNPSNMTLNSFESVNDQQTTDIYVNPAGTRAYFGTNSSSQREFFILNTTNKNNPSVISSYDTSGMSIKGIAIVEADNRAVLVGTSGQEYQAVNIATETSISKCGGMDINSGISDIDTVTDAQGNAFAYLVTSDNTAEFKILRGGPGGGNGSGTGYPLNGSYTSQIFDSGAASGNVNYYSMKWNAQIAANTSIRFQVRSNTTNNFTGIAWVGPDGTSATYFTNSLGEYLPSVVQNKRYFQYIAYFNSDSYATPYLLDTNLNYQR